MGFHPLHSNVTEYCFNQTSVLPSTILRNYKQQKVKHGYLYGPYYAVRAKWSFNNRNNLNILWVQSFENNTVVKCYFSTLTYSSTICLQSTWIEENVFLVGICVSCTWLHILHVSECVAAQRWTSFKKQCRRKWVWLQSCMSLKCAETHKCPKNIWDYKNPKYRKYNQYYNQVEGFLQWIIMHENKKKNLNIKLTLKN